MSILPVAGVRPVDVLRRSSDQIRRAAALLAEITEDTAAEPGRDRVERLVAENPATGPEPDERERTIRAAQRSFAAGLRLALLRDHSPGD